MIGTCKSSSDKDRPSGDAVGFSISNFSLRCRLFMVSWNSFAFSSFGCLKIYDVYVAFVWADEAAG